MTVFTTESTESSPNSDSARLVWLRVNHRLHRLRRLIEHFGLHLLKHHQNGIPPASSEKSAQSVVGNSVFRSKTDFLLSALSGFFAPIHYHFGGIELAHLFVKNEVVN